MMDDKLWWQSRTIWLNIVTFVLGIGVVARYVPPGVDAQQIVGGIMGLIAFINIVLRFLTKTTVTTRKGDQP